ncbi:MAG TPA: antitoxin Xre/MbcA/ParS toxin-binding domain-containing protein [Nitrospiraceae bacterium]|jgi:putative toxin-antitoxin system antitoxin component (TIGR02293 family)
MPQAEELFKTLGGSTVFKKHLQSTEDVRAMIHKGFPYRSLEFVLSKFHLDLPRMSRILSVPPRTMARRKAEQRLTAQESDRLARLARILSYASTVFGSEDKASTWLTRPHRVLEGTAPIELLDTDLGTQVVEAMLGRIEHGVIG